MAPRPLLAATFVLVGGATVVARITAGDATGTQACGSSAGAASAGVCDNSASTASSGGSTSSAGIAKDKALQDDSADNTGLGLLQKDLLYKIRDLRVEGGSHVLQAADTNHTSLAQHCRRHNSEPPQIPLTPGAHSELEIFTGLGLVGGKPCAEEHPPSFLALFPGQPVEEKNKLAKIIMIVWFAAIGLTLAWSLYSVLVVPRKREWENSMTQRKLNLANEDEAMERGLLYWMSLSWVDSLMGRYGKCLHAVINDSEIVVNRDDKNFTPFEKLRKHWGDEVRAKGPEKASLSAALYKLVGFRAMFLLVCAVVVELLFAMVGMVIALDRFMNYLERMADHEQADPSAPVSLLEPTIVVVVLLFGVPMVYRSAAVVVSLQDGWSNTQCAAGLASLVFEKALSLPVGSCPDDDDEHIEGISAEDLANRKPTVAQILNVDIIEGWAGLFRTLMCTILAPFIAMILFAMLIQQLRLAGVIGCLYIIPCMASLAVCQLLMIRWWKRYQGYQDTRLRNLTETLLHIRTIKSLAWESLSFKRLSDARAAELNCNQKTIQMGGLCMSLLHSSPWLSLLIAMYANLVFHGGIQAHQIIIVQRIMMSLLDSLGLMQMGLRRFAQVPNSFNRIKTYLNQPDRPEGVVREPPLSSPNSPAIRIQGNFTFIEGKPCILRDLDIAIPRGELVAVIGAVASGKSALLQAIIGELYAVENAHVEAPQSGSRKLAFCSQVPWIFEGTLRENVVMRNAFDEDRYQRALHAAALAPDLQVLPGGDQVTIGSNGIRLSGGQRARVALARAAYMTDVEVAVIDDPFASVDVPTGQHLLEEYLHGNLMQGRTRIVVTQPNAARLRRFDRILLMREGRAVAIGPPAEVMKTQEFLSLLTAVAEEDTRQGDGDGRDTPVGQRPKHLVGRGKNEEPGTSLRDVEALEYVTWGAIRYWLQAAGWGNLAFFGSMIVCQRLVMLRENLTLALWIDAKVPGPADDRAYMASALCYVLTCCVVIWLVAYAASRVSISAAAKMHQSVVYTILRAPIDKFFDKQPVGRLITRLSFDMRQVDDYIPLAAVALLMFFFGFFVTQSFILSVMPTKIVFLAIPFYISCFTFAFLYRGTAVPLVFHSKFGLGQMQDLQAVVLTCSVSIRANGMFDEFMARYNHQSASIIRCQYLIHFVCKAWVQARIFLCLSTLTCVFAIGGLWSRLPMGVLGTVVSLSFQQMVEFENISTVFTQFINILNALQRIVNYLKIPQEGEAVIKGDPMVRLRVKCDRASVPQLRIRRGAEVESCLPERLVDKQTKKFPLVVCMRNQPVLKATSDGLALEPIEGCNLSEVFPGCRELKDLPSQESFRIVAANSRARDADALAEELCNPSATLWLDLWNSAYSSGMRIQLEDLTAGYGNDKSVLENVCIDIQPREKVGFAGKTGCGKSTTLLCVLRILEPRGGRILIGGMDTSKMGLNTLRSMVGLVPQDPTCFQGTWRYNIDPFNEFPEGRIWEALHSVQLVPYIRSLPAGIDSEITQDGMNISFGQRQLLSLARMVIRQPPVLLLDECTSALDPNTQQAAQNTLLHEFPMSTMIAIAHRVETILEFDRVVVFDKGGVAENGSVKTVMSIENGIFKRMVEGSKGGPIARPRVAEGETER